MLRIALLAAVFIGLTFAGPANSAAQPTSEGHPTKWQAVRQSMADFIADGFQLKAVTYDTSEVAPGGQPDVQYFLQKDTLLVRCDFRKRDEVSIYWCYRLTNPRSP
jgi:hypothetical protein